MMKKTTLLLLASMPWLGISAQETEITSAQASTYYQTTSKKYQSVHDPSIVWEPNSKRYYIFGSHRAQAYTTDLQNWTWFTSPWQTSNSNNAANKDAFVTPAVKKVKKGGVEVDLPVFNAMEWAARTDASYNIDGNMWAPDVIWNPTMKKWCQYLSINGDKWHSSIILLTSDNIEGPYRYQAPVVISGFYDTEHTYKDTDLELVIGTQSSLPSRYAAPWASTTKPGYPNNIDPCVFYDETGKLWMVYGSWSGGVWMLELDETTGLRDYDVKYSGSNTDAYFGKRVAGGYYASGEAPYIVYVNGYYYLFVTYGGLDSVGGYVMRVFRSTSPDGPYKDAAGVSAIFDSYKMNYGKNADNRGVKILGAYDKWGFMSETKEGRGELSQGHNSVIHAEGGRTYLVYHTRFNDGSEGHLVRVHQLFQTKTGWLVASPFEYNGETLTDEDIATKELFSDSEIAGTYQLLRHKYDIDYANRETVTPVEITLTADGKVTGAYSGTWVRAAEGTSYIRMVLGSTTYNGVLFEQQMDGRNMKTISFSALATNGVCIWGYRLRDDYALAWQLNNQSLPLKDGQTLTQGGDYYSMYLGDPNITLAWTSSQPDVLSGTGRYNPQAEDVDVTLKARLQAGKYFWQQTFNVKAAAESYPEADWQTGMVAHYGFNDAELANTFNGEEKAQLKHNSTTSLPTLQTDSLRNGQLVHLNFGAHNRESYVAIPNPFYGRTLENGATLSFWLRRDDAANLWDALYGFYDPNSNARLYMTGNLYTGYNNGAATNPDYLDLNHPNEKIRTELANTHWHLVTVVFNRKKTQGIQVYVDGRLRSSSDVVSGSLSGSEVTKRSQFDYDLVVDHLAKCQNFYLGYGSFWGSAAASYDDVIFYDRALSGTEVPALNTMCNRVYDFSNVSVGISDAPYTNGLSQSASNQLFDLSGRRVNGSTNKGVYIRNGKKIIVK